MAASPDPTRITQLCSLRGCKPLLCILLLTAALRLPGIERPLVGNFATKNVVYAMIARNWIEHRADWRYPTLDCLVGGHRSLHMLEFPATAYLTGWLWSVAGGSLDVWGRALAILMSTLSTGLIYLLVLRRHGSVAALGAAMLLTLSPVDIIYGQSFMLESSLVLWTLAAVYGFDRWLAGGRVAWLVVAALSLALLLLTKIYMVVILLPLVAWLLGPPSWAGRDWPGSLARRKTLASLAVLGMAVLPAALWYGHAASTAAADNPFSDRIFYSVRQSAQDHWPPHPLLRSADFYRQLLDDLSGVVLTPVGLVLVLAGFVHSAWRRYLPWLLAMAVLILLLPRKFHEMNYYWMAVLPPLSILAGLGWHEITRRWSLSRKTMAAILLVGLLFSLRYALRPAFATPPEDRAVVAAGQALQKLAGPEKPVVTMHGTGIDLLYYCHRPGWCIDPDTPDLARILDDCRRQGARRLVFVDAGRPAPATLKSYRCLASAKGFAIYDLSPVRCGQ